MRIDIYSDTVCAWCFLAKRRFELALAERPYYEPRVIWRPFELNPDLPWEGVDRAEHMAAKLGEPARIAAAEETLARLGEDIGLRFRFDLIRRVPNSRRSHLLIAHASRHGRQGRMQDRIMQAYFQEGVDIGELEELVRLGLDAGLSERECRAALVLREGQDGVVAAERHAAALGITARSDLHFRWPVHHLRGAGTRQSRARPRPSRRVCGGARNGVAAR